jgi:hypothetical protein
MSSAPSRRSALKLAIAAVLLLGVLAAAVTVRNGRSSLTTADVVDVTELQRLAAPSESFGFVQSVRELADGRVLVADPLGGLLVRMDLESGTLENVGREGSGPGEWRQPDAVLPLPGDSTLLVDLGNARLSVLDPDGGFVRSYPMAMTPPEGTARPPGPMGMATEILNPRITDASGAVYYQARPRVAAPGTAPDSAEVKRWNPRDGDIVRLAGLRPPAVTTSSSGSGDRVAVRMQPIPLAPQDDWAVAPDGRLAIVRAEPYHVQWLLPDSELRTGRAVEYAPVPIGTAEKERWLEAMGTAAMAVAMTVQNGNANIQFRRGGSPPGGERSIDEFEWPSVLPAFREGSARVDWTGRVWVERYQHAGAPALYDVFDEHGTLTQQVRLPSGRQIIGFGSDRAYTVWGDDLGLHHLEVYALAAFD